MVAGIKYSFFFVSACVCVCVWFIDRVGIELERRNGDGSIVVVRSL
jgi:hypothetical protein